LRHRVREPDQKVQDRDYDDVESGFPFSDDRARDSEQGRQAADANTEQLHGMIERVASGEDGMDKHKRIKNSRGCGAT